MKKFLFATAYMFCAALCYSQDPDEGVRITAGVELRSLLNLSLFNIEPVVLFDPDNNFRGEYSYAGGLGFGGVVRVKLTNTWNMESGLYFTRRKYDFEIRDLLSDFEENTAFRVVAYEIPVKGLVYLRMAEQVYMSVSLGAAANFFASDVASIQQSYNIKAFKLAWMRGSVLGSIGAEYRTESNGYFYMGFTFNQTFDDIMITEINYFRNRIPPAYRQRGPLDGTYLSLDFRYFFPMARPKPKVKYTVPDWKKLR